MAASQQPLNSLSNNSLLQKIYRRLENLEIVIAEQIGLIRELTDAVEHVKTECSSLRIAFDQFSKPSSQEPSQCIPPNKSGNRYVFSQQLFEQQFQQQILHQQLLQQQILHQQVLRTLMYPKPFDNSCINSTTTATSSTTASASSSEEGFPITKPPSNVVTLIETNVGNGDHEDAEREPKSTAGAIVLHIRDDPRE